MNDLIDVFKMDVISPKVRAKIIIKLGDIINYKMTANITEPIVYELVKLLDPENKILNDEHYTRHLGEL